MSNVQHLNKTPPNVRIFKLTIAYFATGMFLYIAAMAVSLRIIPLLVASHYVRSSGGLLLTHLYLLGFATMIAMGASFQLTQIILRTNLYSKRLGIIQFFCYVFGTLLLTASLYLGFDVGLVIGGSFIFIAVLLYTWNLFATFILKKEWNPIVFGVSIALINLLGTVSLGMAMGSNFAAGWMPHAHEQLFYSHIWLGVVGWLAGFMLTYSFKLLPMFYNSPRKAVLEAYLVLSLFQAGVWLHILSIWTPAEILMGGLKFTSELCVLVSLLIFNRYILSMRAKSRGVKKAGAVRTAFLLLQITSLLTFIWICIQWFMPEYAIAHTFTISLLVFLILGWFPISILSYMTKMVPFLWWAWRFHTIWEKKSKVLLSDMLHERKMTFLMYSLLVCIFVIWFSFMLSIPKLAMIGQWSALLFLILSIIKLLKVFRF